MSKKKTLDDQAPNIPAKDEESGPDLDFLEDYPDAPKKAGKENSPNPDAPSLDNVKSARAAFTGFEVKVKKIYVEGLGENGSYVYIKGISGSQRSKIERMALTKKMTSARLYTALTLGGLCDESGRLVFSNSEEDQRLLMGLDSGVVEEIGSAVQRMSGMGKSVS